MEAEKEAVKAQAKKNEHVYGDWIVNLDKGFSFNTKTGEMKGVPKEEGKTQGKPLLASELNTLKDSQNALNRLNSLVNSYSDPDKKALFGTGGLIRRSFNSATFGTVDPESNQYNQDIGMLKRGIAKAYEGGRMSDQDRAYYDQVLFNPNASQNDFISALDKYSKFLDGDLQNTIESYSDAGRNVSGFSNTNNQNINNQSESQNQSIEEETTRRNKKTGETQIFRGGQWKTM
jgi:hypothetical protein